FPCFDEPRFKTPWELTIHVKQGEKAFANARETSETEEPGGRKAVHFAATKPLPAEVVAFAIGPFDVVDARGGNTPMRAIVPKGRAEDGRAAAQIAPEVLARLEDYTGIPYQFGKLDHIAVPEGTFGAVENPGLITYLASRLLIPPGEESDGKLNGVRAIMAHEMTHQWFGDLVTQATWRDVWLSEGFAQWLSAKILDEPGDRRGLAGVAAREKIMRFDQSRRTRPVRVPMHSRKELRDAYSRVIYDKGAAILFMLDGWLGDENLREGLRAYLHAHEFGGATTADLESALREATRIDPAPVMDSFLDQTGVPEIRGEVRCGHGNPRIRIEQVNPEHHWSVPVCWRADGSAPGCAVVTQSREIKLPKKSACPAWIYLNSGGTGYYRTDWTDAQLKSLARAIPYLTAPERLTLAYDLHQRSPDAGTVALLSILSSDEEREVAAAAVGE
ncbi:MAG: M1 family aminopeptidase, partial [Bryobacteraceae bacterium]